MFNTINFHFNSKKDIMNYNSKLFFGKFSGEIKITFIASLATIFITTIISVLLETKDPKTIIYIASLTLIIILILALLINLKRLLSAFFFNSKKDFIDQFENIFEKSLYKERLNHFSGEKKFLAKLLVEKVLPNLIRDINKHKNIKKINLLIDSGTTITPIFKHLIGLGIPVNDNKIEISIYTNNLAGINEINKIDQRLCKLTERDFNLIGGKPLNNYKATTGPSTQNFLQTIWDEQNDSNGEIISVAIVTANWILGGLSFDNISLCAKGDGHYEFKVSIIENSKYVIVVTPLGKILGLESVDKLNSLLPKNPKEEYRTYTIKGNNKRNVKNDKKVILLTSFRSKKSLSPFVNLSIRLSTIREQKTHKNYHFSKSCANFEPKGDKWEVTLTELPHHYIRDNFESAYNYKLS